VRGTPNCFVIMGEEQGWRCETWGPLGILESLVKLVGIISGIVALALNETGQRPGLQTAQGVILIIASSLLTLAIFDRLQLKDYGSMVFLILNLTGHWCVSIAAITSPPVNQTAVLVFAAALLLGDLVKIYYFSTLETTDESPARGLPKSAVYGGVALFVLAYAAVIVLAAIEL